MEPGNDDIGSVVRAKPSSSTVESRITELTTELAYGAVPRANDKANKVLTSIAMDPPPTLDRSLGGFSKGMKEFVEGCLVKDPAMRSVDRDPVATGRWLIRKGHGCATCRASLVEGRKEEDISGGCAPQ